MPRIVGGGWEYIVQSTGTIKELIDIINEAIGDKARVADHYSEFVGMDYDRKRATGRLRVDIEFPIPINEERK